MKDLTQFGPSETSSFDRLASDSVSDSASETLFNITLQNTTQNVQHHNFVMKNVPLSQTFRGTSYLNIYSDSRKM